MPFDTSSLASLIPNVYHRPLRHNKLVRFIFYLAFALIGAFLLSLTFGQHYDGSSQKLKGAPKHQQHRREVNAQNQDPTKDPFANRPRIRTKNGHLVIEASQDKNIDFKTSGSRGTITINGHKLDQLLNVTKALERSASSGLMLGNSMNFQNPPIDQYDAILRNLFGAGERLNLMEKSISDLRSKFTDLDARFTTLTKKVSKKLNQLNSLTKQQDSMLTKLKRNDCFNQETGQPTCKNGATCLDAYDGFKCLCTAQFEGPTCSQDVDECQKYQGTELGCQNGAKCVNLPGGYKCECPAQYHGIHCTELHDDCGMSSSSSLCGFGKCVNLMRSQPNQPRYECICDQGWTTDGSNPACVIDINECMAGHMLPSSVAGAANSTNQFYDNNSGQTASMSLVSWIAASPTQAYPCSQNPFVECTNLPGSFQCGPCPAGYTGNGRICRDLDECQLNNGGCSQQPLVECINSQGSRRCGLCPPGYTGDGVTCSRVSACNAELNGGCHPMAKCVELAGLSLSSRLCVCKYPYVGDGSNHPDGCKPLPAGQLPVPTSGSSNNSNSSVNSSLIVQTEFKQDDCNPNPCMNNAKCRYTENSFECICPLGWMGNWCQEPASVCGGSFFVSEGRLQFSLSGSSLNDLLHKDQRSNEITTSPVTSRNGERHYGCKWSISVAQNMSIKLDLSGLINKLNPSQKVQMYAESQVQVSGSSPSKRRRIDLPNCAEYLDVWDRLDLESVHPDPERRLLARFCSETRGAGGANLISLDPSKQVSLQTESHAVELEYSFVATRTQFGEPALAFNLSWLAVAPPCGGEFNLNLANPSGSISSPKFPEFYEAGTECRYLLRAPAGQRIRLHFAELSLLSSGLKTVGSGTSGSGSDFCADSLTVIDGIIGSDRPVLLRHCANNATLMNSRIPTNALVSSSSSVEIILVSNFNSTTPLLRPKQRKGFLLTYTSEPASPGCGGLYTRKSGIIKSGDYEPYTSVVVSAEEEAYASMQLAMYLSERNQAGNNDEPRNRATWLHVGALWSSQRGYPDNSSSSGVHNARSQIWGLRSRWYKSRCEYEIRPAEQSRNHKVAIDWLELPSEPLIETASMSLKWSRRLRCSRSRLVVYDGEIGGSNQQQQQQQDGSRREIATFCAGDKYNSSSPIFPPVISSGHLLYLVYETVTEDSNFGAMPSDQPDGFKLHYSTVCSAIYNQLSGRIKVEISEEVPECIYHLVLPPDRTITLMVEPQLSDLSAAPTTNLPTGQCAAQTIFMDGAIQGGAKAIVGIERVLRGYSFGSQNSNQLQSSPVAQTIDLDLIPSTGSGLNQTTRVGVTGSGENVNQQQTNVGQAAKSSSNESSYWQYSSSQVHDIKEFDVCKLAGLSFDSIWNHLSILFRLNQNASSSTLSSDIGGGSRAIQLTVGYRSEPSCGGIISEPTSGKIQIESRGKFFKNTFFNAEATVEKACNWVFRAASNQVIQMQFEVPVEEIKQRFKDWLNWSINSRSQKSTSTFNCSQVFKEEIEIYEPSLNRTRQLCPMDLVSGSNSTLWVTQSSIALIRVHNSTEPRENTTSVKGHWPGLKPLSGPISVNYQFLIAKGRNCGGRLFHDSGIITSPRFPFLYPPLTSCVWVIQTNPHQQIRLNVTKFQLESSPNCLFDYLELRNGPDEESPLIGRFCGRDLQSKVLVSHSSMLWLHFKSDGHLSHPGFEIRYDGAQTGCGGQLTTASGQIDSPNYPFPFTHSADCEWIIELSQSNKIELTIQDLDLSSSAATDECSLNGTKTNYLAIYDSTGGGLLAGTGSRSQTGKALLKACHKSQLIAANRTKIISGGNKLLIVFKSQALDNSRGFRLTYKTLCSGLELIGFRGVIESPGFPASYPARISCGWTIKAPLGSNLTLAITEMDLEESLSSPSSSSSSSQSTSETPNAFDTVPIIDYNSRTINKARWRCSEDALVVWAIYPNGVPPPPPVDRKTTGNTTSENNNNSTSSLSTAAGVGGGAKVDLPPAQNSRMVRYFCGQLNRISNADRYLELNTNVAYLSFDSDRSVEGRGFRLEWRSEGCGGAQLITGEFQLLEPIKYREPEVAPARPTECLWTIELAHSATMEFTITSDMRSVAPDFSSTNRKDPCDSGSLILYDGLNDKAPILNKNCDTLRVKEVVSTSGGQALLRLFTSGNHTYGRNFQLSGRIVHRDDCLTSVYDMVTPYNQHAGFKQSPLYPDLYDSSQYHCYGQVSNYLGRVKFNIEELDIPIDTVAEGSTATSVGLLPKEQCKKSGNYLLIKGLVSNSLEEFLCGKLNPSNAADLARSTIVMEHESAWLEFHTSKAELRGRWRFSYERLCGSFVQIYFERDFYTPNYPEKPQWPSTPSGQLVKNPQMEDRVCIWRFSTSFFQFTSTSNSEKKLHFSIINFIESPTNSDADCIRVYEGVDISLTRSSFNLTELDFKYAPKLKICKLSDLGHKSMFYVSQGAELIVLTSGNVITKFRMRPFEEFCGSEMHLDKAEFASLAYPQTYPPNLDCTYFIIGAPGSRVNLKFIDFDLPEGELPADDLSSNNSRNNNNNRKLNINCDNVDHVEIRQLSMKKIIEHRMKQRGSDYYSDHQEQESQDLDSETTTSGSSLVVMQQTNSTTQNNTIKSIGKQFSTERWSQLFKLYNLFNDRRSSSELIPINSRFSFDDFHESSELLGRFCGKQKPQISSFKMKDQILVRFRSHDSPNPTGNNNNNNKRAPRGFLAEYKLEYGGLIKVLDERDVGGIISSPRYPGKSLINGSITWNFETKLDHILQFELIGLDLGSPYEDCRDTLNIYDGLNPLTSLKLSRMCGSLTFKSMFSAPKSNSNQSSSSTNPQYAASEPQVKANLIRLVRSSSNIASVVYINRRVQGAFLLRYKAISLAKLATMKNISDVDDLPDQQSASSGIDLDGKNASLACSGSFLLNFDQVNSSSIVLNSPNWPKSAPQGIECHWLVYTHDNTNIKLVFDTITGNQQDSSDTSGSQTDPDLVFNGNRKSDYCLDSSLSKGGRRAFVVVHDGASRLSPQIGRYCLPGAPINIQSSGRHMFIRYVNTDESVPTGELNSASKQARNAFRALASVGDCGGQYHIVTSAIISHRPTFKQSNNIYVPKRHTSSSSGKQVLQNYTNNMNCKYYLFAGSKDEVLVINEQLSSFKLAKEPTNENCTIGDYLEIRDLPVQSELMDFNLQKSTSTGRLLGRYCAGHPLEYLESPGSALSLEFKTDSQNVASGWKLYVTSGLPNLSCPQAYMSLQLDAPYWRINSPNWPHGFQGKRKCRYLLVAPNNQSIEAKFVRLRRQHNDEMNPEKCTDQLTYLADNEAVALRYRLDPLAEVQSPLSGARMRELVKSVACDIKPSPLASSDSLDQLLTSLSSSNSATSDSSTTTATGDTNLSYSKRISAEEYYKLQEMAQYSFNLPVTRSHVLMLNYESKNLLPNEGFVALFKLVPQTQDKRSCGGEIRPKRLQDPESNLSRTTTSGSETADTDSNLILSGGFGKETLVDEEYIQCEWTMKQYDSDSSLNDQFETYVSQMSQLISYKLTPSQQVGNFATPFIVFDTLEIPPLASGQSLIDQDWSFQKSAGKSNSVCGLDRLLIGDVYYISTIYACGNLTNSFRSTILEPFMSSITIRTKNLRLQNSNNNQVTIYRGVKGRLYEKVCQQFERLIGEGIRIKSHANYPNSSYQPGICQWQVRLSGGDYHLWFDSVRFRSPSPSPPNSSTKDCDSNSNLDYLEVRASISGDSPVISRICAYNQANFTQKNPLLLSMKNELKLVFVAGIDHLASGVENYPTSGSEEQVLAKGPKDFYGFDMELVRVRNISDFCKRESRNSIYFFIRNRENVFYDSSIYTLSPSLASFLYPKNTHCEIPMVLQEGQRFNFTFKGMFDFESSIDCKSDYIQLDDIVPIEQQAVNQTSSLSSKKNQKQQQQQQQKESPGIKRIGRWCGRNRPTGYFISRTEKIRIIFHSNDRVEGKGFQLEYSVIPANSTIT